MACVGLRMCKTHPVPLTGSETRDPCAAIAPFRHDTPRAPHGVGNLYGELTEDGVPLTHPVPLTGSETSLQPKTFIKFSTHPVPLTGSETRYRKKSSLSKSTHPVPLTGSETV